MSVRITDAENVAMYDSVTGTAFGPIFTSETECQEFQEWAKDKAANNHTFKYGHETLYFLADLRVYRDAELEHVHQLWNEEVNGDVRN